MSLSIRENRRIQDKLDSEYDLKLIEKLNEAYKYFSGNWHLEGTLLFCGSQYVATLRDDMTKYVLRDILEQFPIISKFIMEGIAHAHEDEVNDLKDQLSELEDRVESLENKLSIAQDALHNISSSADEAIEETRW